ncbi:MAG: sel1 repeat family protein [Alphaproteobacteria bacterium]|nr:sel1 repeat family protein [Alphaproteobacteria bacterium]
MCQLNVPFKVITMIELLFIFFINFSFPICATLQKSEYLMNQGKLNEAMDTLSPYVEKNDPHALYLMSMIYLSPTSSHYNFKKGLEFLEKAVFQNYAPALDELAGLYLSGDGVNKNEAKALEYYRQAAHMGYGPSQFNCGIMYKNGQGTQRDFVKAYLYLSLASLNYEHLHDVTMDAAFYRDSIVPYLTSQQRQDLLRHLNSLTLPKREVKNNKQNK